MLEALLDARGGMREGVPERQQLTTQTRILGHARDGNGAQAVRAKGLEELDGEVGAWGVRNGAETGRVGRGRNGGARRELELETEANRPQGRRRLRSRAP